MTDRDKGICCAIKGLKLVDPGKSAAQDPHCDARGSRQSSFIEGLHARDCIPSSLEELFHA